ncbi:hypothetical protein [Jeotgalibacillus proteolyticus]|uniref:Uncharacterized protein n=1 Tax=Jeotgalibacillus proteolyticus TaxID=2082395 RepID=A0A2S5GFP6_9BACL|nr:hypothetical protein [Jeotgalibacillus proteolyticus]PPA71713.1 hypothetical protein C4B60_06585 [Jeotgalibacillus proteolyticus]
MNKATVKYKRHDRISHYVNDEYSIIFDRCTPIVNGVPKEQEQLLMRYTKNGNTINNAPAFNEKDMVKAIVKLYESSLISEEAKEVLEKGINKRKADEDE